MAINFTICFFFQTGAPVSNCGFFKHPLDPNYGASPDGLGEAFSVEVKTRAENSEAPLEKVSGAHLIQTNFQMICCGGKITFLQFYLPEKNISNFFCIIRNDLLLNNTKDITDHILEQKVFDQWHHDDNIHLRKLGEQVLGHMATFENLRHFRSWVNNMAKSTKIVVFV